MVGRGWEVMWYWWRWLIGGVGGDVVLGVGDDDPSAMVGPCGEWVHDDWEAPMRACEVAMIALALPVCVSLLTGSTLFFFPTVAVARALERGGETAAQPAHDQPGPPPGRDEKA